MIEEQDRELGGRYSRAVEDRGGKSILLVEKRSDGYLATAG